MLSFAGKNRERCRSKWINRTRGVKILGHGSVYLNFSGNICFVPVATQTLKMTGRIFSYLFNVGEVIGYG